MTPNPRPAAIHQAPCFVGASATVDGEFVSGKNVMALDIEARVPRVLVRSEKMRFRPFRQIDVKRKMASPSGFPITRLFQPIGSVLAYRFQHAIAVAALFDDDEGLVDKVAVKVEYVLACDAIRHDHGLGCR